MDKKEVVVHKPDSCNNTTSFYKGSWKQTKIEVFVCHVKDRRVRKGECLECPNWAPVNTKIS